MVDYMVGRLNGLYLPGNPSDYRKKNNLISKRFGDGEDLRASSDLLQERVIKTARLKEIIDRYFPPEEVKGILAVTGYRCIRVGNNGPLDKALKEFSKADEVRKAARYLRES